VVLADAPDLHSKPALSAIRGGPTRQGEPTSGRLSSPEALAWTTGLPRTRRAGSGAHARPTHRRCGGGPRHKSSARGGPPGWSAVCPQTGRSVPAGTPRAGGWPADLTDAGRFARRARVAGHLKRLGESGPHDPCAGAWARTGARLIREGLQRARGQASMAPKRGAPEQLRTDPPQSPADAGCFQRDSHYPMCGHYQARWGANGG